MLAVFAVVFGLFNYLLHNYFSLSDLGRNPEEACALGRLGEQLAFVVTMTLTVTAFMGTKLVVDFVPQTSVGRLLSFRQTPAPAQPAPQPAQQAGLAQPLI